MTMMKMNMHTKLAAVLAVMMFMMCAVSVSFEADADSAVSLTVTLEPEDGLSMSVSGVTVTAEAVTTSYGTVTGVTDAAGSVALSLSNGTMWYVYGAAVGDYVSQLKTFDPVGSSNASWAVTLEYQEKYTFTMTFNSSAFVNNPASALTYAADCVGYTPVDNSVSSGFTSVGAGSWGDSNPLISHSFYGLFSPTTGEMLGKLNPSNLAQYEDGTSAASAIQSNNVMWCIPTTYIVSTSTSLTLTNDHAVGVDKAYAHTYDRYIYEYCCPGVYEGTNVGGKLMSISGSTPTASLSLTAFRPLAAANEVENGHAMLWNFYQYQLMKYITLFSICDFDSQSSIGFGNSGGSGSSVTGQTNSSGYFAGNKATGTSNSVKAYIENSWGSVWDWVDNVCVSNRVIYAGSSSTITDTTSGKTSLGVTLASSGYPGAISTGAATFGIGTATGGSQTGGTFDYQYSNTGDKAVYVGGGWGYGLDGGVSCLGAYGAASFAGAAFGARLAYVCDAAAASPVTTVNVTFDPQNGGATSVVSANVGGTVSPIADPVRASYLFAGWYTTSECTTKWSFSTPVTAAMTLYAKWESELVFVTDPEADAVITPGYASESSIFDASDSTLGCTYEWDLGDGTTGTGMYTTHVYADPGTYTVTMTVTTPEGGVDTYSSDVEVVNAPLESDLSEEPTGGFNATGWAVTAVLGALAVGCVYIGRYEFALGLGAVAVISAFLQGLV